MATIHLVHSDEHHNLNDDWESWKCYIEHQFPRVHQARHGDLIEDLQWSGERSQGVGVIWRRQRRWDLLPLETDLDDYGCIPAKFPAITEFPLNHWHLDVMSQKDLTNSRQESQLSWHSEYGSAPWMHVDPHWVQHLDSEWHSVNPSQATQALQSPLSQFSASHGLFFRYKRKPYCILGNQPAFELKPNQFGVIGTQHPHVGLFLRYSTID